MSLRPVKTVRTSQPTIEGAGVKLRRAFGFGNTEEFDPFLLLDDFRNENPADYLAGFPWHPHRGIETITYVLAGTVAHGDSLGNRGTARRRRRAVDDGGQRHPASGDAAGRPARPHARLPAVGEPAVLAQDDDAALPGRRRGRHPRGRGRRRHDGAGHLRQSSGASAARSRASRPTRAISTSPCRPASASGFRSTARTTRSPTSSRLRAPSATRRAAGGAQRARERRAGRGRQPLARALRPRRRGDGAGGRRGDPLPARLGPAARGAGRLAGPDRDEHAGGAAAGDGRARRRHVHQEPTNRRLRSLGDLAADAARRSGDRERFGFLGRAVRRTGSRLAKAARPLA